MSITGYEDDPLADGSELLDDPAFWAVHAGTVGAGGLEDVEGCFGVDVDDAEDMCERLFDHDRWPVFAVPLRGGASVRVVYRNLDGDMGLDYLVSRPGRARDLRLASVEGCFAGPGLCWDELAAIAEHPPAGDDDALLDPARRLLMLLPALGDAGLPGTAVPAVAAALAAATPAPDPTRIAELLLQDGGAYWEPARWGRLSDGALVCDGRHSLRGPENADALALTRDLAGT